MPENQEHNSIVIENGTRYAVFGNICWYTNLDTSKRHEDIVLYKNYTPEEYPFFDNYNAINVEKVKDIPCDYDGLMGVPITFLDKYNPNQFTIVGSDYDVKEGNLPEVVKSGWTGKTDRAYMNGKRMYSRLLIKHKK
jgi:hypothetical protein